MLKVAHIALIAPLMLAGCIGEPDPDTMNPQQLYEHFCGECHGNDGLGRVFLRAPSLVESALSHSEITYLSRHGRSGDAQMPPHPELTVRQAQLIANHVFALRRAAH